MYKIGKNKVENWYILENSKPSDYFFHLSSFPSCYVILEIKEKPTLEQIVKGAEICKEHTKFRNLKNLKVDYCRCDNVVKGDVIGEAEFVSNRKVKQIKI